MQVLTSIEFLQGTTKVFETPLVEANSLNVPGRGAVAFAFDIPLDKLTAGLYICQVNVIDDTGGSFSFPRQALLVRAAAPPPAAPTPSGARSLRWNSRAVHVITRVSYSRGCAMKAVLLHGYGGVDQLVYEEVPIPTAGRRRSAGKALFRQHQSH